MKSIYVVLLLLTLPFTSAYSQIIRSKLDLVGGISAREYVHGGLRYQYTDLTQLGLSIGGDLGIRSNEIITTYSIDHMIHFGNISIYSGRGVWYARQGFTYSVNVQQSSTTRWYSYINLGAGREFTVNDWLGFNLDLGLIWQVREKIEERGVTRYDNLRSVLPLARFQTFISF